MKRDKYLVWYIPQLSIDAINLQPRLLYQSRPDRGKEPLADSPSKGWSWSCMIPQQEECSSRPHSLYPPENQSNNKWARFCSRGRHMPQINTSPRSPYRVTCWADDTADPESSFWEHGRHDGGISCHRTGASAWRCSGEAWWGNPCHGGSEAIHSRVVKALWGVTLCTGNFVCSWKVSLIMRDTCQSRCLVYTHRS